MKLYFSILQFSFLRLFAYPFEIIATALRTIVEICFLVFFWSLYTRSADNSVTVVGFASYFLIASGVNELAMSHWGKFGSKLSESIQSGRLNSYLIKPVSILPTFYFKSIGRYGINKLLAITTIIIGLIINLPTNSISLLFFFLFFLGAVSISYAYNILDACMFFYSGDAKGMRNALNHMIGIFSGLLIPISLFPEPFKGILELTPFPWMVFGPVNALKMTTINSEVLNSIGIVLFWSITLNLIAHIIWAKSLKKYEAIGI